MDTAAAEDGMAEVGTGEAEPLLVSALVSGGLVGLSDCLKLPRFRRVVLDLGDYGSVVTASIAAS